MVSVKLKSFMQIEINIFPLISQNVANAYQICILYLKPSLKTQNMNFELFKNNQMSK